MKAKKMHTACHYFCAALQLQARKRVKGVIEISVCLGCQMGKMEELRAGTGSRAYGSHECPRGV